MGKNIQRIPRKVMSALQAYHWPGNIRELQNIIERLVVLSPGKELTFDRYDLFSSPLGSPETHSYKTLDEIQKDYIINTLKLTNGRISGKYGAALILGLKPTTLRSRMEKLGINIHRVIDDRS